MLFRSVDNAEQKYADILGIEAEGYSPVSYTHLMRFQIADYLGIPGDSDTTYALMGAGFNLSLIHI